jgi:hypothetical protein
MDFAISPQHGNRSLVLLAPSKSAVPVGFTQAGVDQARYWNLLAQVQRLRGAVYLEDGAIKPNELTEDERYAVPADERSWHVVSLDERGRVKGGARFYLHSNRVTYSELGVSHCALAASPKWGGLFRRAICHELAVAQASRVGFAELGGWALDRNYRCTTEALRIVLATHSLANLVGDAICVSTATVRNCSASILQRLGGKPLELAGITFPVYNDPKYNCDMEVLRFDSRRPAERFVQWIAGIRRQMTDIPVVCGPSTLQQPDLRHAHIFEGFSAAAFPAVSAA